MRRACSKSPEQESKVDGLETGVQPVLAVLPQPSVLFQPGEAVPDNPALGPHLEDVQLAFLGYRHGDGFAQNLLHTLRERLACVAVIAQEALHLAQRGFAALERQ